MNTGKTASFYVSLKCKDPVTAKHSEDVAHLAFCVTEYLLRIKGASLTFTSQDAYLAGLMHDIGKLKMPDEILKSNVPIKEPRDNKHIRSHPYEGFKILHEVNFPEDILQAVLHHHERYDGSGYPDGKKGREIPKLARLIGLADAHNAITTNRAYRKKRSPEEALEIIKGESSLYDPEILSGLLGYLGATEKENSLPRIKTAVSTAK